MNAGSLFSGIGGLDLGVGVPPAWFCEYDKHCRAVLERHWPGVPVYTDVREMDKSTPRVDVLHGGYPCQPFSVAGKREGENDPRHLWPEFARLIRILRPRVVIAENVAGHLRLGFHAVLADLAALGMDVRWGVVRASDVGAPHRRERLFIVAHSKGGERSIGDGDGEDAADANRAGSQARGDAGSDGARVGLQPLGSPEASTDADVKRLEGRNGPPVPTVGRRPIASTDTQNDGRKWSRPTRGRGAGSQDVNWGAYEPAIRRWEQSVGGAPRPTDERGRLMPEFVEWMMGFPEGWTDGVSRTQRLKMLGNAVVPQQAALALDLLT